MLCIQDQRDIHDPGVQVARFFIVQHVQEMAADGIFVRYRFYTHTIVRVAIPIGDYARQGCKQSVCDIVLVAEIAFRLDIAQERCTRTHHVHGVCIGGDSFEHFPEGFRQCPHGFQAGAVGVELGLVRKVTVRKSSLRSVASTPTVSTPGPRWIVTFSRSP